MVSYLMIPVPSFHTAYVISMVTDHAVVATTIPFTKSDRMTIKLNVPLPNTVLQPSEIPLVNCHCETLYQITFTQNDCCKSYKLFSQELLVILSL